MLFFCLIKVKDLPDGPFVVPSTHDMTVTASGQLCSLEEMLFALLHNFLLQRFKLLKPKMSPSYQLQFKDGRQFQQCDRISE